MKKGFWFLALTASLALTAQAVTVFEDTFESPGAVRHDDANDATDLQWRPRVGSQAGAYSVANDVVFGNALKFRQSVNSLWLLGQFDNDASDGITFGGNAKRRTRTS